MMVQSHTDFLIFEVKDTGEYSKLNITEEKFQQNNGKSVLSPSKAVIIVKEELRRIYLWKGVSSTVRRKFIASRVASELQRELMNSSNFHRCKIVSVDQGDEPEEFLNNFNFQKIPFIIDDETPKTSKPMTSENHLNDRSIFDKENSVMFIKNEDSERISQNIPTYENLKKNQKSKEILEKVLKNKVPQNFIRRNILVGNTLLYGETTKKAEVFSNQLKEKEWEPISRFSDEIAEIDGAKLRIHINKEQGEILAIEILEFNQSIKKSRENLENFNYKTWTVKELKHYCRENSIHVPSSYRKADIIRLVIEHTKSI